MGGTVTTPRRKAGGFGPLLRASERVSRLAVQSMAFAAALLIAFLLYYPALGGEFVLDDYSLPLAPAQVDRAVSGWLSQNRPVLILSYGANAALLGSDPFAYHAVNLLIHVLNAALVALVLRRLLRRAGWAEVRGRMAALAGALVFLVHPLQTESVSYIAGRSESLSSFFLLLAYTVFLCDRRGAISWRRALAVVALFALAVKTKENAVSLAGILFLTDIMWPRPFSLEGPRRNWRLYVLMVPGALLAAAAILRMLATAGTAGFSVANYTWYQYAFTQARAIFAYLQLAVLPVGQALDHDFAPSHTLLEHGAGLFILALAAMTAAAIRYRRRFPLACFGFFMFLVWLAPTSSVVPVDDALVERRMYLPLLGLILIGCEIGRHWRLRPRAAWSVLACVAIMFGGLCHARNRLWAKPDLLLALSAENARYNPRPLLNVAEAMMRRDRCDLAIPYLDRAERILPGSYAVVAIRGRALACLGRLDEGMAYLQAASRIRPCSQIYQWIGLLFGEMGRLDKAGANLRRAVELDPGSAAARGSLALWHESTGDLRAAEREYAANLALDPYDRVALAGIERVRRALGAMPGSPQRD